MEITAAVNALSALAHETRLSVFRRLVQAGPEGVPAGELARGLDVIANTMSAHLNVLGHAGLVQSRRVGRSIIYSATYDRMTDLLAYLMEDCCGGSPEVCAPLAAVVNDAACCVTAPGSTQ
ncbi:ArsR/SmtB family transcription factor [Sphingomonas oryzagri]